MEKKIARQKNIFNYFLYFVIIFEKAQTKKTFFFAQFRFFSSMSLPTKRVLPPRNAKNGVKYAPLPDHDSDEGDDSFSEAPTEDVDEGDDSQSSDPEESSCGSNAETSNATKQTSDTDANTNTANADANANDNANATEPQRQLESTPEAQDETETNEPKHKKQRECDA